MSVLGKPISFDPEALTEQVLQIEGREGASHYEEVINAYDAHTPFMSVSGYEEVESYALATSFNTALKKVTKSALEQGKGIATGTPLEGQIDVLDALKIKGKPFYDYLAEEFPGFTREEALATFLLRVSACYIEVPTTRTQNNTVINGYTKFIATANYSVVCEWLGGEEMRPPVLKKFQAGVYRAGRGTATLDGREVECDDTTPYVKLDIDRTSGARKVVNPRTPFDVKEGTRITPLYVLELIADYIKGTAETNYTTVKFIKDSGDIREITTTYNQSELLDVYGKYLTEEELAEIISNRYDGDYFNTDTLTRGYVRFTSVGESYHEQSLNRSISLSRVLGTATGEDVKPNIDYINVNTKLIAPTFRATVHKLSELDYRPKLEDIAKYLKEFELSPYTIPGTEEDLFKWVERAERVGGTNFLRSLASFMVALPHLFPEYANVYKQELEDTSNNTNQGTAEVIDTTDGLF